MCVCVCVCVCVIFAILVALPKEWKSELTSFCCLCK